MNNNKNRRKKDKKNQKKKNETKHKLFSFLLSKFLSLEILRILYSELWVNENDCVKQNSNYNFLDFEIEI